MGRRRDPLSRAWHIGEQRRQNSLAFVLFILGLLIFAGGLVLFFIEHFIVYIAYALGALFVIGLGRELYQKHRKKQ